MTGCPNKSALASALLLLALVTAAFTSKRCEAASPRVVMLIGEDEYKTWETLPEFAKTELEPLGTHVTIIQADEKDKNSFPGLIAALAKADLLIVSVRRRVLPKDQVDSIRGFLNAGKPLVGIRTACHAFAPLRPAKGKPTTAPSDAGWPEFDPEVLGGHYTNHYGPGPKVAIAFSPGAETSHLLEGIDISQLVGNGSLYKVGPLDPSCVPLLVGTIPEKPAEPIAWTRLYGPAKARVFYTALGHPDDFKEPAFRKLLLNGILWSLRG